MRKADAGDVGPLGELIARSVTGNLYRFVVPAVAGPARLVRLVRLADKKAGLTQDALRVAAIRGRLRAQKTSDGTWLSSKKMGQRLPEEPLQARPQHHAPHLTRQRPRRATRASHRRPLTRISPMSVRCSDTGRSSQARSDRIAGQGEGQSNGMAVPVRATGLPPSVTEARRDALGPAFLGCRR
jgi:hypothetical protein